MLLHALYPDSLMYCLCCMQVYVSDEAGVFPPDPVVTSTWADDRTWKIITFDVVTGASVRLVALSPANGQDPWASGAELEILGMTANVGPAPTPPSASLGGWSDPISTPLVAVAAALLPNGRVCADRSLLFATPATASFGMNIMEGTRVSAAKNGSIQLKLYVISFSIRCAQE